MSAGRYLIQVKNPDAIGWIDVASRESWDAAETFADALHRAHGIEVCVAQIPIITPAQLAEGDLTAELR